MLADFVANLRSTYADAGWELIDPASSVGDVEDRVDALCCRVVKVRGLQTELDAKERYAAFVGQLSAAIGVDAGRARGPMDSPIVSKASSTALTAGMLGLATHADAADGGVHMADVVSHGGDAFDIGEAVASLGLSLLLSAGVAMLFRARNDAKRERLAWLTERAFLTGRLASRLMCADSSDDIVEVLDRIRETDAAAAGATQKGGDPCPA